MWRTTVIFVVVLAVCAVLSARLRAEEGSTALQERLEAFERRINKLPDENPGHYVNSSFKSFVPFQQPHFATETFSLNVEKEDASPEIDRDKQEFGNVTAALKGGQFTSFSYSSAGLDLKKDYGITLLLKTHDLEIKDVESERSLRDTFVSKDDLPSEFGVSMYQQMKALVPRQQKSKNYTMTGMGLNFEMGGLNVGVINFIVPPEKKRKVFYGTNTQGPYNLNITSILPGSEEIMIEGGRLSKGADYDINYTRGEVTFTSVIPSTQEIIIEFELAAGSGSEPSKFTGFRADNFPGEDGSENSAGEEQSKEPAGENAQPDENRFLYGFSYFNDELIRYNQNGTQIGKELTDHTLMGFDTKYNLGKNHSFTLEYANSTGDKQKELGTFATKYFTTADTKASDKDPKGPYYLDEDKLPVVTDADAVFVNGVPVAKEEYSLDPTDGRLIFKGNDLNFFDTDEIEVRYRYLTEQDSIGSTDNVRSGAAYAFSSENQFGSVKNTLSYQKVTPYFTLVGGRSNTGVLDMNQNLSWEVSDGLEVDFGFSRNENLDDAVSNLKTINRKTNWGINYKNGERLNLTFKTDSDNRYDNRDIHNTDTKKNTQNFSLSYKFNKQYQFSFKGNANTLTSSKPGSEYSTLNRYYSLDIETKPFSGFKFDASLTSGNSSSDKKESVASSAKSGRKYKLRYVPNESIVLFTDLSQNQFRNSGSADNGNQNTRIGLNYIFSEKTTFFTLWQNKREIFSGNEENSNLSVYDLKIKPIKKLDLQMKLNSLAVNRTASDTDTAQRTIQGEYQLGKTDKLKIRFAHNSQTTKVVVAQKDGTSINTNTYAITYTVGFNINPYYRKYPLDFEISRKLTRNNTSPIQDTRDTGYKLGAEIPFLGKTSLQTDYFFSVRSGNQNSTEQEFSQSLKGSISKNGSISLTFKSKKYRDKDELIASTSENIWLMSGDFKW